jgi:colanic acid/amylovoran biosynthesis glycosyltransferase
MLANGQAPTLRVGYVVKRYPRFSETFIVNEILALEARGVEVTVFALYPPTDTHFQDILAFVRAPVIYVTTSGAKIADMWEAIEAGRNLPAFADGWEALRGADAPRAYQALRIAALARQRGITHLHAHFATAASDVAGYAAALLGISFTLTAHAKDIFHESVEKETLRTKMNSAAAVVTVSDFNVDYLRDTVGVAPRRLHRIYNGLDLSRFPYRAPTPRPRRVVAVGRLVEKKGFDVLLHACAILQERGVEFTCDIIGSGEEENSLRALHHHLGLGQWVTFGGPRPQREIIQAVQNAAVFAAPCVVGEDGNRDGLPTVLLEAMALGTPCISTDVTGIPEILHHNQSGLLVPQKDANALADAIQRLLDDDTLRCHIAANARALMEASFDVAKNGTTLHDLFLQSAETPMIEMIQGVAS